MDKKIEHIFKEIYSQKRLETSDLTQVSVTNIGTEQRRRRNSIVSRNGTWVNYCISAPSVCLVRLSISLLISNIIIIAGG